MNKKQQKIKDLEEIGSWTENDWKKRLFKNMLRKD